MRTLDSIDRWTEGECVIELGMHPVTRSGSRGKSCSEDYLPQMSKVPFDHPHLTHTVIFHAPLTTTV